METKQRGIFELGSIGAFALALVWAAEVRAYPLYRNDASPGTDDCYQCHGDFRASPYASAHGGSWGDDLHDVHRTTMLGTDSNRCNICHSAGSRVPVYLNQSVGTTGFDAISCIGCHGRQADRGARPTDCADAAATSGPCGDGAGLRQHHWNAGETVCGDCHGDANPVGFTPVGENVKPPYYFTPDVLHPMKPTDPCNPPPSFTGENFKGATLGLDTDGDGAYDMADTDCAPVAPTPTVTSAPTPVPTATRTAVPTATPVATQTVPATATAASTPVETSTGTRTPTPTPTATATDPPTQPATPTATPAPKSNCDAGKMQCVDKKQACLLRVNTRAAKHGVPADVEAIRKCTDAFDGGTRGFAKGCIGKLEDKEDPRKPETVCTVTSDVMALEKTVDAFVEDVVSEIAANPTGPNECNAGRTRCVSKRTTCLLNVHQNAVRKGVAVDGAALDTCNDRFAGCIGKLEADPRSRKTTCSPSGDVVILASRSDTFVADVVRAIRTTTPEATRTAAPTATPTAISTSTPVATRTAPPSAPPTRTATPVPTRTATTVVLCHEREKTIRAEAQDVSEHLAHGDTLGPCPSDDEDDGDSDHKD